MSKGIRPGQVPDWRPGAEYWKPLADGREVTIYPLLGGKGRLCVGPLADPNGYDIAYRYENVGAAIEAAKAWDGEETQNPPDFEEIEFGKEPHPATIDNPSEELVPGPGSYIKPSENDNISLTQESHTGDQIFTLTRHLKDGRSVRITGPKRVRTDGLILCEVTDVQVRQSNQSMPNQVNVSQIGKPPNEDPQARSAMLRSLSKAVTDPGK